MGLLINQSLTAIPLGFSCRTAYQLRRLGELSNHLNVPSSPFDWTMTSFRSLSKTFANDISPFLVLNAIDSYTNYNGSVSCGYLGLSFHHDLPPSLVSSMGGEAKSPILPPPCMSHTSYHKQDHASYINLISCT